MTENKSLEEMLESQAQKLECPICHHKTPGVISDDPLLPPAIICDYCGSEIIVWSGHYFQSE